MKTAILIFRLILAVAGFWAIFTYADNDVVGGVYNAKLDLILIWLLTTYLLLAKPVLGKISAKISFWLAMGSGLVFLLLSLAETRLLPAFPIKAPEVVALIIPALATVLFLAHSLKNETT